MLPEALMPAALRLPLIADRWALATEWMLAPMIRELSALIHKPPPEAVFRLPPKINTLPPVLLTDRLPLEPLASVMAPPLEASMVAPLVAVTLPRVMALP